jgi:hypothetical protein
MDGTAGTKGKTLDRINGRAQQDLNPAQQDGRKAAFKAEETAAHARYGDFYGSYVDAMGRR